MTDLENKENSENNTNILALDDNDLNIPLEASKTVKKKKVLTERYFILGLIIGLVLHFVF